MQNIKKYFMTLALLLTAVTGAWAAESKPIGLNVEYEAGDEITSTTDVYVYYGEELNTLKKMGFKITSTQPLKISEIIHDRIILNGDAAVYYLSDGVATGGYGGGISCVGESTGDATVVHVASGSGTLTDPYVFGSGPSGTPVPITWDATNKTATFTMPAGNVELQVEYYPGMLVKPTSLVGGTLSIEGLTDTTLPEGFEKDAEGNIYVAKDTKFTVKATPAEGYHLVGWSDDATNKELEREFTMTDDDFTITAQFSDAYDIAFNAANANTIESGKATVKVGDAAATVSEGKIQGVKAGQTVTLTAATGYKFRKAEAKKGIVKLLSITVGAVTIYYAEGENWTDAINRAENKDSGLFIREGNRVHHPDYGQLVDSNTQPVLPDAKINANESYKFVK